MLHHAFAAIQSPSGFQGGVVAGAPYSVTAPLSQITVPQ